jgi:heme exporter protein C
MQEREKKMKILRFISTKHFDRLARQIIPILAILALILSVYGTIGGLHLAPADYQQGNAFRIIYVHVPSAFLSLLIYFLTGMAAAIGLIFRIKLFDMFVSGSLFLGAWFTLLALVTGCIWAKPMWGTWWIWDARLTSELILLFLYLGVIALKAAIPERRVATQASAVLLMLGLVNLPIIHYSVYWWNTLHQGASIRLWGPSLISPSMLHPLLAMIAAFIAYYFLVALLHVRCEILERETSFSARYHG